MSELAWTVLLLGGSSGTGKSTVAAVLGRRLGVPWLAVDDLRLTLQYSGLVDATLHPDLFFFQEPERVRHMDPEQLAERLAAIARLMAPTLEIVIATHLFTKEPVIIEGDGILPAVATRAAYHVQPAAGRVRAICLAEEDEDAILENMRARGRGIEEGSEGEARIGARMSWLYGRWLRGEAERHGLPALPARPWATLPDRILAALA